jgi:hypothetical protein
MLTDVFLIQVTRRRVRVTVRHRRRTRRPVRAIRRRLHVSEFAFLICGSYIFDVKEAKLTVVKFLWEEMDNR